MLVVDDNLARMARGQIADEVAYATRVYVLYRPGKLGSRHCLSIQGFRWALARDYQFVFEMDADFSHQPKYLPELLRVAADADLVLGCRYMPGGGTEDWTLLRKLVSKGGNLYARTVMCRAFPRLDGGFGRVVDGVVLETIDPYAVTRAVYAFQIELIYRTHPAGFSHRRGAESCSSTAASGQSKMSGRIVARR